MLCSDGQEFPYNLRFPGQYYDSETGLNQNWNRDYDPVVGRYVESDPIGLELTRFLGHLNVGLGGAMARSGSARHMGVSLRLLLLDQADRIYRLDITRFERMRVSPGMHPLPQFAGQRVRSAEVAVELVERRPARILHAAFSILAFDQTGCLDAEAFRRHQVARSIKATGLGGRAQEQPDIQHDPSLLDDRGGQWVPTKTQLRSIHDAALRKKPISRL